MEHPSRPATPSSVDRIGGLHLQPGTEPGAPAFEPEPAAVVTTCAACGARTTEPTRRRGSACGCFLSCSDDH